MTCDLPRGDQRCDVLTAQVGEMLAWQEKKLSCGSLRYDFEHSKRGSDASLEATSHSFSTSARTSPSRWTSIRPEPNSPRVHWRPASNLSRFSASWGYPAIP